MLKTELIRKFSSEFNNNESFLSGNNSLLKNNLRFYQDKYEEQLKHENELRFMKAFYKREWQNSNSILQKKNFLQKDFLGESCECSTLFKLPRTKLNYIKQVEAWLHAEIKLFETQVLEVNENQRKILEDLISHIDDIVKSVFPNVKLQLFGSFSTGLCLPWSDIDMVLDFGNDRSRTCFDVLSEIDIALNNNREHFKEIKFIKNANFPVIKIVCSDHYFNKKLDITFLEERHNGLNCVSLVKEYLVQYEDILRPLIFILKQILFKANLNDPYGGGLSSYGLILMMVALLQWIVNIQKKQNESPELEIEGIKQNLGKTLLQFLNTYGCLLETNKCQINPNLPNKSNIFNPFQQFLYYYMNENNGYITVIDPINKDNNVTKASYNFGVIRMIFSYAYLSVNQPCSCDLRALRMEKKRTGKNIDLKDILDSKFDVNCNDQRWRVLPKILNSYKSPFIEFMIKSQTKNY